MINALTMDLISSVGYCGIDAGANVAGDGDWSVNEGWNWSNLMN